MFFYIVSVWFFGSVRSYMMPLEETSVLLLPWIALKPQLHRISRPLFSNVAGTQRSRLGSLLWGALVSPSNYSKNFLRLWWVGEEQNKVLSAVESSESRRKLSRAVDWCGLNPWAYQKSQVPIRRYVKAIESLAQKCNVSFFFAVIFAMQDLDISIKNLHCTAVAEARGSNFHLF